MIKLKQIQTHHGVAYFVFEYDREGEVFQVELAERHYCQAYAVASLGKP